MNRSNTLVGSVFMLLVAVAPAFSASPSAVPKQAAPKFEIVEAKYGNGAQSKDVKAKLMALRQDHFILAEVSNESMGGDAVPDKPKELVVRTRVGKTEREQRFPENSEALILMPSDPEYVKSFAAQAKDKLVILEAKKVKATRTQDWIEDVRAAVKGQQLKANTALGLTQKTSVLGGGKLVIVYLDGQEIRAKSFGNSDPINIDVGGDHPVPAANAPNEKPSAESRPESGSKDEVVLAPLPTDEPVTTYTMTPDGAYLIMAHQAADLVSVWDVRAEKTIKVFATPQPRSIFCPGDQVFIANYGKGTITVFSIKDDWRQQDELKVDREKLFYLSGAMGTNFKNQLLAVCEPESRQDYNAFVYLVDTAKDKCREVSRACVATVSADGKTVITQGSFNLSPSGGIELYQWDEFIGKNAKLLSGIGDSITYAYPAVRGSYWIHNSSVYAGSPIAKLKENLGIVIVPDIRQPIVYSIGEKQVTANRLDTQMTEIGKRKLTLPPDQPQDVVRFGHYVQRHRGGHWDHPIACVHGNDLYIFALDVNKNTIQYAKTASFTSAVAAAEQVESAEQPKGDLGVPARIASGKLLSVRLNGSSPASTFALVNGPDGMKIDAGGQLTWTPDEKDVGVHELKIRIRTGQAVSFARPSIEVLGKALVDAKGGAVEKVDEFPKLELGADHYAIFPGLENRTLLLLQGNDLKILKPDGFSVDRTIELPARYRWIAERGDCYIAASTGPQALDVIDKSSLKVRKHVELPYAGVSDLAIDPSKKISYVAVQTKAERPNPQWRVLKVDEQSGQVTEPPVYGTWVKVDPTGSTLIAGYKMCMSAGMISRLIQIGTCTRFRGTATLICSSRTTCAEARRSF